MEKTHLYGLIGKNIGHSFSKAYFTKKFEENNLDQYAYENFDLPDIGQFLATVQNHPNLKGLNVTIPYKESVIPKLDKLSRKASEIGAVNTIKFTKKGTLKGYNTDWYGFTKAIGPLLQPHHQKALILGTGGASKAVAYALEQFDIPYAFVSRDEKADNAIGYDRVNATTFDNYQIIINCTPLGTSPDTEASPLIPYEYFTPKHLAFDLIYNPEETVFLKKARAHGAITKNGYDMLVFQAEKAWRTWNK